VHQVAAALVASRHRSSRVSDLEKLGCSRSANRSLDFSFQVDCFRGLSPQLARHRSAPDCLPEVIQGIVFKDGIKQIPKAALRGAS
jgi:hypothetical protein